MFVVGRKGRLDEKKVLGPAGPNWLDVDGQDPPRILVNQNPPVVNCASINAQRERGERNRRRLESSPADRRTSGAPCPCPVPSLFLSPQSRSAPVDDLSWLLHWEWTRFSAPCSIGSLYIVSKAVNQVTQKGAGPAKWSGPQLQPQSSVRHHSTDLR